ncbi:hypothetical protein C817_04412 [Dorea sp. 5-2]|nr:hypothetical protein C817_04412 [Dorea sp. 5-2]
MGLGRFRMTTLFPFIEGVCAKKHTERRNLWTV